MDKDSLEGPHDEEAMDLRALRRGMNFPFKEEMCEAKDRVRSSLTPRKVGVGLKWSFTFLEEESER